MDVGCRLSQIGHWCGLLTLGLALIFAIALFVIDVALGAVLGAQGNTWSLIGATAFVILCYNPVTCLRGVDAASILRLPCGFDAMKRNVRQEEPSCCRGRNTYDG